MSITGRLTSFLPTTAWHSTLLLVTVLSLLHFFILGHVELSNDKAQYALYRYYPDWSYFDLPSLSEWVNTSILLFLDSEFALRIWPLLLLYFKYERVICFILSAKGLKTLYMEPAFSHLNELKQND